MRQAITCGCGRPIALLEVTDHAREPLCITGEAGLLLVCLLLQRTGLVDPAVGLLNCTLSVNTFNWKL